MSRPVLIVVHQHLKTVPGGLQVFTLFFKLCANGFTQCRIPWGKRRGLPKMCPIYHACKRQDSDGIMESLESWNHSMMMESWTVTNISCMQEPHQAFCSQEHRFLAREILERTSPIFVVSWFINCGMAGRREGGDRMGCHNQSSNKGTSAGLSN